MRRYLWILALFSGVAFAAAPVIWESGEYGKFLTSLGFKFNDDKEIRTITVDPTAGAGVAAPIGSLALEDNSGSGRFWFKLTSGDTGWTNVLTGGSGWSLFGNGGLTPGTGVGEAFLGTTDATDVVFATDTTERLRITSTGDIDTTFSTKGPVSSGASGILSSAAYLELDEIATPSTPASDDLRLFSRDEDDITKLSYLTSDGQVLDLSQDNVVVVRNETGSTLTFGQAVYISGESSGVPTVSLAQADAEATSDVSGIVISSISNNSNGRIMKAGKLNNINTSAFSAGDTVYLSASSAGGLTTTPPSFPNFIQRIGRILVSNATTGEAVIDINARRGISEWSVNDTFTFGASTAESVVIDNSSTTQRTATFPDKSGTVALVGDAGGLVDLTDEVTGILPLANGGTGIDSSGATDGQLLIGGTASNDLQLGTLTGTANQVVVTNGTNSITLSTPQDIDTSADVQFGTVTTADVIADGSSGLLLSNSSGGTVATIGGGGGTQAVFSGAVEVEGNFFLEDAGAGTDRITMAVPSPLASDYTLTLPPDGGTNGYLIQTDGSGTLTYVDPSSVGSAGNLQATYDASTTGEIVLDGTIGGIRIEDASTPLAADLFTVSNNGDSTNYLNVTDDGVEVSSLQVDDLTNGRVLYASTLGEVTDSAAFTFDGSNVTAGGFQSDLIFATSSSGINIENDSLSDIMLLGESGGTSTRLYGTTIFEATASFQETGAGTDTVNLTAPSAVSSTYTITLPDSESGASGRVLRSTNSTSTIEWSGVRKVTGSTGSPQAIAASTAYTPVGGDELVFVNTASGAVNVTANPQLATTNISVGDVVTIMGTSDTNYPIYEDGDGLVLNGSFSALKNHSLQLLYDGTNYVEIGRATP